MFNLRITILI